jgi:hypothetical protein
VRSRRPRFAAAVEQPALAPEPARQAGEDLGEVIAADEPMVPGAVERRHRRARRLAAAGLRQGLDEVGCDRVPRAAAGSPVRHDERGADGEPTRAVIQLHVEPSIVQDEDTESGQQRHAVEPGAERRRVDERRVGRGRQVASAAGPQNPPAAHGLGDRAPGHPFAAQARP